MQQGMPAEAVEACGKLQMFSSDEGIPMSAAHATGRVCCGYRGKYRKGPKLVRKLVSV